MPFSHDVVVGIEYQQNGETKKRWTKVGSAFTNEKGQVSFKLDFVPARLEGTFFNLFKPEKKE
jgi:hypothetical protein